MAQVGEGLGVEDDSGVPRFIRKAKRLEEEERRTQRRRNIGDPIEPIR
jgi:hypothetical protein